MKLYDMKQAPNPRRVRMFLAEKGVEIEHVEIDVAKGENLSEGYLSVSPRGLVPALELDDGTVIDESVAICRYFEETHPEPNLMGKDAKEKAIIESWQRRMEFDGLFSIALAFRNSNPNFEGRAMPGAAGACDQIPALAERGRLLTERYYVNLNKRLGETGFVAGERFTIADITAFVGIDFARWIKLPVPDTHENTRRWYEAVSARPSAKA